MSRLVDITGRRFGRLSVLGRANVGGKHVMWICRCDCGETATVRGSAMKSGNSTTCGCGVREAMSRTGKTNKTHGQSRTPEYRAWARMLHRCYHTGDIKYTLYGGRGVTVCDRWHESFETFVSDMGPRPSPGHSLDRRDSNGVYEPSNCRWATLSQQNKNRRPFKRNRTTQGTTHGCA
jgi:hypothetical protein